jgi:hypothetical protein
MADDRVVPDGDLESIACRSSSVWQATLTILEFLSASYAARPMPVGQHAPPARGVTRRKAKMGATPLGRPNEVSVVERVSADVVAINWRDSLLGCYFEQHWRRRISRRSGTCVLSGAPIARGSVVYAPSRRAPHKPHNAGAMILAIALDAVFMTHQADS